MKTFQHVIVWLALASVAACGNEGTRRYSADASTADARTWSPARYVEAYDGTHDGVLNGRVDGYEGPLCDVTECLVYCGEDGRAVCMTATVGDLPPSYIPTCDQKNVGVGCDSPSRYQEGTECVSSYGYRSRARCLLPWDDARVRDANR